MTTAFGVAITTVGRWQELANLLDDVAAQTLRPRAVAVAFHADDNETPPELAALVHRFADTLPIRTVVSPRGVSHGRNTAAAALPDTVEWLHFPNDTTRIDPDFFEKLAPHCVPPATVCAVQMVDDEGSRNPLPAPGTALTRRNVWGAIEPATLIRREAFLAAGGFDTALGSGADSPWQAGEGTDLLLRMSAQPDFLIQWVPDVVVHAHTEFAHLPAAERRRKLRRYGRGAGHLLRTWRYPLWYRLAHLLAAALMPLRNPGKFTVRDSWALLLGRTEGVLGRTLGGDSDYRAVSR
ncbi:glycosyltransferase [Mycolicibacterium duvalii]|uniref:Uncharacterized protein n=1 Tax=Mycolicibacterium duvalii TaxID=39688 RepID=A0A7I7K3M2_9MYCO|nr:glycosyltransferase [Mycolicibacterium duvalii]MCV7370644.1 glycosyltransferase [Mycolicibacterium duvalii]PEG36848.1 glycosyltransferase [Mycolicibacterium duvalii]BBX17972.1 hypothetical protein MDUV_28320 [Mycolicibacterium duvalii]